MKPDSEQELLDLLARLKHDSPGGKEETWDGMRWGLNALFIAWFASGLGALATKVLFKADNLTEDAYGLLRRLWYAFPEKLCREDTLAAVIKQARRKHPVFAKSDYEGLCFIAEEFGECAQAINKGESIHRVHSEAMDLFAVTYRFYRDEYRETSIVSAPRETKCPNPVARKVTLSTPSTGS